MNLQNFTLSIILGSLVYEVYEDIADMKEKVNDY